ncbi:MAG: hypothetical protein H7X95_00890, partial [Deltaproteobacteria bacterium]|nr:hypothetical protein [Deltaproteobacteria bacterium]
PPPSSLPSPSLGSLGKSGATLAELMAAADASVDAAAEVSVDRTTGMTNLEIARSLYQRIVREFPQTPEAAQARRALKILAARDHVALPGVVDDRIVTSPAGPSTGPQGQDTGAGQPGRPTSARDEVVVRQEPYSTRTSERLRLTSWEKLDFGVTSFLYGAFVGLSFAISSNSSDTLGDTLPIALGAATYTVGAVAYLHSANPDRGDLPLALAITSYVPTTVLLVSNLAFDNPDEKNTSLAVAAAGVFSIPVAIAATSKLNLDPGDMQLVRDAGFWGLTLATAGSLGFAGDSIDYGGGFESYQAPTARTVAGLGLLGLYGGLGLGMLAAANSEISLERTRVTTWGGYGGALLGALVGVGVSDSERGAYSGLAVGALAGLIVTFAATGGLDGIPPEEPSPARASRSRWTPTMVPIAGVAGQSHPGLGLSYASR